MSLCFSSFSVHTALDDQIVQNALHLIFISAAPLYINNLNNEPSPLPVQSYAIMSRDIVLILLISWHVEIVVFIKQLCYKLDQNLRCSNSSAKAHICGMQYHKVVQKKEFRRSKRLLNHNQLIMIMELYNKIDDLILEITPQFESKI